MENVFKIHKQTLSTGEKSVMRNVVHSFSYSKSVVESFQCCLRGTIEDSVYLRGLS